RGDGGALVRRPPAHAARGGRFVRRLQVADGRSAAPVGDGGRPVLRHPDARRAFGGVPPAGGGRGRELRGRRGAFSGGRVHAVHPRRRVGLAGGAGGEGRGQRLRLLDVRHRLPTRQGDRVSDGGRRPAISRARGRAVP